MMDDTSMSINSPSEKVGEIIFKNSIYITLGDIAIKALNFLFSIYVIRRLGDDRFGQYSIVLGFVGVFQIFAELGVTQYAMREMAQDASKMGKLFWNLVVVRLILALIGMIGITLLAYGMGYSQYLVLGIFVYTWSFLLAAFQAPLAAVLMARERLDSISFMNILGRVVFLILGTIFMLMDMGFISLIVATLLGIPAQIGLAIWSLKQQKISLLPVRLDPHSWIGLIRGGLPFSVISLMLSISFHVDTLMLSRFEPEYIVGWYNVAYSLIFSLMFFAGGFNTAVVPSLARTHISDPQTTELWYYRTVKIMLTISFPLTVGGYLTAFPLFKFLYTPEYLPGAFGLQILIWDLPLFMYDSFCGNMTTIIRRENAAARIYGLSAFNNVVLNLYAIPRYGLVGAALVTVITDFITAIQFYFLLRDELHFPNILSFLSRLTAASGLMGVAVWLVRDWNLFLQIGLGVLVFTALAWGLRLVTSDELNLLTSILRRTFSPNRLKSI